MLVNVLVNPERVRNGTQSENAFKVQALDRRFFRFGARRQDQLVIALGIDASGPVVLNTDQVCLGVDRESLVHDTDIQIKAIVHRFWRLDKKRVLLLDHVADIVGQATVCVRYVLAFFQQDDFRLFVEPAQAGCRGCSPGDAADHDNLHVTT